MEAVVRVIIRDTTGCGRDSSGIEVWVSQEQGMKVMEW